MASSPYIVGGPQPRSDSEQAIKHLLTTVESFLRGMWRYRWRALLVAWLVSVLGWTAVLLLPPVYQANARVFVDTENAIKPLVEALLGTNFNYTY